MLEEYVKEHVADGVYSTPSDYVRDLIQADLQRRGRERVDALLLEGIASGPAEEVTPAYMAALRADAETLITRKRKPK